MFSNIEFLYRDFQSCLLLTSLIVFRIIFLIELEPVSSIIRGFSSIIEILLASLSSKNSSIEFQEVLLVLLALVLLSKLILVNTSYILVLLLGL